MKLRTIVLIALVFLVETTFATTNGKYFDRIVYVIFENTNYSDALKQPFFAKLAKEGAHFTNFMALTHPSQGNYIALTSGDLNGVRNDKNYDVDVENVVDLLEAKNISWKVYAEGYPGNCFTGARSGYYVRKHNPLISYVNIQKNPERCKNIVNATEFEKDVKNGTVPSYIMYIPDLRNDAHDTSIAYGDKWYQKEFKKYFDNASFMENSIIVTTFDENGFTAPKNQIYTTITGPNVKVGFYNDKLDIPSLLKLVEENWDLGNLGKRDVTSPSIPNIWK